MFFAINLPLRLFPLLECLQNRNPLLKSSYLLMQGGFNLCRVVAQLRVEVLSVWSRRHSGTEDRLHDKRVVLLEGCPVGGTERVGELLVGVGEVVTKRLSGEIKATVWFDNG